MKILYTHHPSLYFSDGNVALLVSKSINEYTVFRVHQSLLSKLSPVFETMFSMPKAQEDYDGTPAIFMQEAADQVECLLRFIYHDIEICPNARVLAPITLQCLLHILTLMHKFEMDTLRQQLISTLECGWPSTLSQWDATELSVEARTRVLRDGFYSDLVCGIHQLNDLFPEPAAAIHLACECGLSSIIPAAFYHLSRLSIYDDWDEIRQSTDIPDHGQPSARWALLTGKHFLCLLKGQKRIRHTIGDLLGLTGITNNCSDPTCRAGEFVDEVIQKCTRSTDVLRITRLYVQDITQHQLCPECLFAIRGRLLMFRQQFWEKLPDIFSIEYRMF